MSQLICCDLCGGIIDGRHVSVGPIGWADDMRGRADVHDYHGDLDETGRSCAGRVLDAIENMSLSTMADREEA